jgi:hypothetical protein
MFVVILQVLLVIHLELRAEKILAPDWSNLPDPRDQTAPTLNLRRECVEGSVSQSQPHHLRISN